MRLLFIGPVMNGITHGVIRLIILDNALMRDATPKMIESELRWTHYPNDLNVNASLNHIRPGGCVM